MPVEIFARINVKWGEVAEFEQVVEEKMLPLMEPYGWKLTASYQTLLGDVTEILHLWETESVETAFASLGEASQDPAFQAALEAMRAHTVSEQLSLVAKSPYVQG